MYFSQVRGDKPSSTIFFTSGLSGDVIDHPDWQVADNGLIHLLKAPWMEVGSWMGLRLRVVASCK